MALVFPEMVSQIFVHIFSEDGVDDALADPHSWQARWLRYGAQLASEPNPPLTNGEPDKYHDEWIESVVRTWSRQQRIVANFKRRFAGADRLFY